MSYRIADEPQPGRLTEVAVNPVWPLLAVMFGGAFLSWPWFALNGFAIGSPHRRQELAWAIGGFFGSVTIVIGISSLVNGGVLAGFGVRYALIVLTVWKLGVSYWLYTLQSRSFGIYQHFGGTVRSGIPVVFLSFFVRPQLLAAVGVFWQVVLR